MASEVIKLNLIPKGEMPVFHASQFDTGRLITCELYRGEDAYSVPEGYTVELHCRKVDNNIVTMASTLINDNVVTFTSTEQLTACNGNNLCEVAILDEGYRIGTLNFILEVEIDPLKGGITSTSEIHNLESQIEEITTEIVGENYYNKSEVDTLLDAKADASDVYTKSEVDTALNLKADKSTTYTKSQVDTALALKADAATTYTKSQVDSALALKANSADLATVATTGDYDDLINKPTIPDAQVQSDYAQADNTKVDYIKNKPDIDTMIAAALLAVMPVGTASGSTATFDTEIAAPLVNVSCDIVATGGNGTPSTPIPINGFTEANISCNGQTYTIAFGQTVYGGVLDVTRGKLHVTHAKYTGTWEDGGSEYSPPQAPSVKRRTFILNPQAPTSSVPNNGYSLCNVTDTYSTSNNVDSSHYYVADNLYLYLPIATSDDTAVECSYVIKEPFDIDLTPVQFSALVGTNNVSSDTNGDTTVQYKDSIQHYIDNQ